MVTTKAPVKTSPDTISGKNRASSRTYHLRVDIESKKVCKSMFINTLSISETMGHTAMKKLGDSCGISPDKRGTLKNRPNAISQEKKDLGVEHMNSFPRVASHFCRACSTKDVKTVANMHRLYVDWAKCKGVTDVLDERQYRDIFNNTPGLNNDFFIPKKDQCESCFAHKYKTPEEL